MRKPSSDPYALLVARVFQAAGEMRRAGEAIAAQVGQTQARWQLMSVVSEGHWTVPDAARELGVTRQGVQRIADELVADGLAQYVSNPRHQRSPFLQLTPRGHETLAKITAVARRSNQKMARLLTAEQLDATRDVLHRIIASLQEMR
ncbi:MarR family winged helix-turn-helix transcriptional regulator [Dongia deserti]|uniref:MarR family winged helix-turn-helix transcriptional regulator n=1 Tax=Dongia deserti TaxID=2268030 RepID=UPI000E64F486|nr:MarR family winged helix-turn-helix transcriptional regulator [Dongia deserti]